MEVRRLRVGFFGQLRVHDLALADHGVVVPNDPELDLNTHARPKGCFSWSASLSSADTLDQIPTPTVCHAPPELRPRRLTNGRGLILLSQRGVEAEAAARAELSATYRQFMAETDPQCKDEAGMHLIRAISGRDAIR